MVKKFLVIAIFTLIAVCLFAVVASAQEHSIIYHNLWREQQETVVTDEKGKITIKDTGYATEINKSLICWYTLDGDIYQLGEEVTLTESISLYEGYGYRTTFKNMGYMAGSNQWDQAFMQLQEDLVLDYTISPPWGGRLIIDLNGHTITTSAKNAFGQQRAGLVLVGEGKVIHTGTGHFFEGSTHGYNNDGSQCLIIGKNVTVTTNGILFNYTNHTCCNIPIHVFGEATCSKLAYIKEIRNTIDIKINPKKLTITGDAFISTDLFSGGVVNIDVFGGQLELSQNASTKDYWNNLNVADYGDLCNITISGGTFNISLDNISDYIIDGCKIEANELNGISYSTVVNNTCDHNYEVTSELTASCIQLAGKVYTCKKCNDSYSITFDKYTDHNWSFTEENQPTLTSAGYKRYSCSVCTEIKDELWFADVADEEIKVTVNTADGERKVSVKVSDVFVLEKLNNNYYKLVDLKAFDTYLATDIVSINIPLGIAEINFASNNSTLKKLVINDRAVVAVTSFAKCSALTHIEIGAATVTFENGCSNNVIESIKSEVKGADVTFTRTVFKDKKTIKELKLSSESRYVFHGYSFQNTGITEFIAPDYSDVIFVIGGAFYGCKSLELVYIGRGIETIEGGIFNYCSALQKAMLVDVKEIVAEGTFAHIAGGLKPLEVYIHQSDVYIPRYTFQDSDGVIVYTNTPIDNKYPFDRCDAKTYNGVDYPKYTIYLGIGHKYIESSKEPTCTQLGVIGCVSDCLCGEVLDGSARADVFYGVLTNGIPSTEVTYSAKIIPMVEHTEGQVIYIDYKNGYLLNGVKNCICSVCNAEYTEEIPSANPLFIFSGYSMPEDGRLSITIGFIIDKEAIELYEQLTGKTISYGVVVAIEEKLNGKAPLDSEVIANTQKAELDRSYFGFDLIVSGFTEASKDLAVVMAFYVTDGESTVYLQNVQTDKPVGVSISSLSK